MTKYSKKCNVLKALTGLKIIFSCVKNLSENYLTYLQQFSTYTIIKLYCKKFWQLFQKKNFSPIFKIVGIFRRLKTTFSNTMILHGKVSHWLATFYRYPEKIWNKVQKRATLLITYLHKINYITSSQTHLKRIRMQHLLERTWITMLWLRINFQQEIWSQNTAITATLLSSPCQRCLAKHSSRISTAEDLNRLLLSLLDKLSF